MKKSIRLSIICLIATLAASCSDTELQHRLAGTWVTAMSTSADSTATISGTITLSLDADNLTDTLTFNVPGGAGMLDTYSFAGSWSAIDDQLTLTLSNKPMQDHTDKVSAKVDSFTAVFDSIKAINPDFTPNWDTIPDKAELTLLEALRKNVGCRSTMNIIELTDSTLVIGDNNSTMRFVRQ